MKDDIRCIWAIVIKDLRAYYFKPPNISWGILFPFAFVLAFVLRDGAKLDLDKLSGMIPGLLALTLLFGTSSMEAIVITFERRIGSLERLFLAPVRIPALLVGKLLGGIVFGLVTTVVVLIVFLAIFGTAQVNWFFLLLNMIISAAAFSAMGMLISVSVKEVFEAQTLANAFRFPMMFLGGVFMPLASLPLWLKIIARGLPLTFSVEALGIAILGGSISVYWIDQLVLLGFTIVFFWLTWRILSSRME